MNNANKKNLKTLFMYRYRCLHDQVRQVLQGVSPQADDGHIGLLLSPVQHPVNVLDRKQKKSVRYFPKYFVWT